MDETKIVEEGDLVIISWINAYAAYEPKPEKLPLCHNIGLIEHTRVRREAMLNPPPRQVEEAGRREGRER